MSTPDFHQMVNENSSKCYTFPATILTQYIKELIAQLPFETFVVLEFIALAALVLAILLYRSTARHGNDDDDFEYDEDDEESMMFMRGSKM